MTHSRTITILPEVPKGSLRFPRTPSYCPKCFYRKPIFSQSRREAKFGDIPDEEKQRFYNHFKEKYRYEEEQGLKDEEFWGRLQKDLHGGRYTLDEIWGFAKELQASLDFAHDEGEFHGEEHFWTFYVWDWDMES